MIGDNWNVTDQVEDWLAEESARLRLIEDKPPGYYIVSLGGIFHNAGMKPAVLGGPYGTGSAAFRALPLVLRHNAGHTKTAIVRKT